MEEEKVKRIVLVGVIGIFAAAVGIILSVFILISRASDRIPEITLPTQKPEQAFQAMITPNSGGAAPTEVPSATPEPLIGMDTPTFCKLQMSRIYNTAQGKGAAGMLALNRYDFGKKACIFDIKNTVGVGNAGNIEILPDPETGKYSAAVTVIQSRETILQKWGETVLTALNSDVTAESAEASVKKALEEGQAECGPYLLSSHSSVSFTEDSVRPVIVLEITDVTVPEGNS